MRSPNVSIIDPLAAVIARGQRDGSFRPDADPVDVHMAISALGFFSIANQYTFSTIFGRELGGTGDVGRRRELVTDIILGYLRARG